MIDSLRWQMERWGWIVESESPQGTDVVVRASRDGSDLRIVAMSPFSATGVGGQVAQEPAAVIAEIGAMGEADRWAIWQRAPAGPSSLRWWRARRGCCFVGAASPHGAVVASLGAPQVGAHGSAALGVPDLQHLLVTVDRLISAVQPDDALGWRAPSLDPRLSMDRWPEDAPMDRALSMAAAVVGGIGAGAALAVGGVPIVGGASVMLSQALVARGLTPTVRLRSPEARATFRCAAQAATQSGFDRLDMPRIAQRFRVPVIVSTGGSRSASSGSAVNTVLQLASSAGPRLRLSHWKVDMPPETLASLMLVPEEWFAVEACAPEEVLDRVPAAQRQERSDDMLRQLWKADEAAVRVTELIGELSRAIRRAPGGPYRA